MEVLTPRSLAEALALKAERPDAVPIQGGTDVMVELNFDRSRPPALLNLNEVPELRGHSRENGTMRLGSGLTYTEAMGLAEPLLALAEASRTVGGPQIRNRGTIGGNLGTASPAGDALPPLLVYGAEVELAGPDGSRRLHRLRVGEPRGEPQRPVLARPAPKLWYLVQVEERGRASTVEVELDHHVGATLNRHRLRALCLQP